MKYSTVSKIVNINLLYNTVCMILNNRTNMMLLCTWQSTSKLSVFFYGKSRFFMLRKKNFFLIFNS